MRLASINVELAQTASRVFNGLRFTSTELFHKEFIARENGSVALDLSEITRVDRDVVRYLALCTFSGNELRNCPAFIQEWFDKEKSL